jgi:hypothetical protein
VGRERNRVSSPRRSRLQVLNTYRAKGLSTFIMVLRVAANGGCVHREREVLVGWTKRSFDFRRERRRWSRCHRTSAGQAGDRETELKFRERMHAPWWHLPTLLSHNQLPCSNPVSSSARSIFDKDDRGILPQQT